jgi:hypothetical protein
MPPYTPWRHLPLAAAVSLIIVLIAACGGGSSNKPTPAAGASDATTGAASSQAPVVTVDDAAYLKAVCGSANEAVTPIVNNIASNPSLLNDQQKLIASATPALSDLAGKLSAIQPPADLKPYHDQLLARLNDIVAQAKAGQLKAIGDVAQLTRGVDVPQDVRDRVRQEATQVPECQQSLLFGEGFFG